VSERIVDTQLQNSLRGRIEYAFHPMLDVMQRFTHDPQVRSTGHRELDRAMTTHEEFPTHLLLEQMNLLAYGRLAHVQLGCGR
jgi:hypothetical protein